MLRVATASGRTKGVRAMLTGLQSGKTAAGLRQVMRALQQGTAARVYVAQDAQQHICQQVASAAQAAGVPVTQVDTMAALGRACRIAVGCAAAAELK